LSQTLRVEAPAKLNLALAVTGRRPDGYHELASVVVLLELADRLLLLPGCSGLRVEGDPSLPVDRSNLAWRGLVAGLAGEPELACLTLEKRIPSASGLGGGSSDAAAAWRLGRRSRGDGEVATQRDLDALARIGADVPFFAARVPAAIVSGIGERVSPLAVERPCDVVLVHPPFALSTAAVFAELRPEEWSGAAPAAVLDAAGRNDLLAAARRLRPELDDVIALVTAAGLSPAMTGSGPTLFALCDDPERAAAAVARLARAGIGAMVSRTRTTAASIESIADEEDA